VAINHTANPAIWNNYWRTINKNKRRDGILVSLLYFCGEPQRDSSLEYLIDIIFEYDTKKYTLINWDLSNFWSILLFLIKKKLLAITRELRNLVKKAI